MDWGFVIGLAVIALLIIGPLVYFGRKFSRRVQKHHPESEMAVAVTPTGNLLMGVLVGFWGACAIAYGLAPQSVLGSFFATVGGVVTVILGSIFFYVIAAVVLGKFGFPITRKDDRNTCGNKPD